MTELFAILIIICALLLVLIILIQNPKGGGLSSSFGGGASQMMGVKKTTDFLEKATWTLAIVFFILILGSTFTIDRKENTQTSKTDTSQSGSDDLFLNEEIIEEEENLEKDFSIETNSLEENN